MHLYSQSGERHRALRQYEKCVIALDRELGVAPSEETDAVYETIVEGRLHAPPPRHQVRLAPKSAAEERRT